MAARARGRAEARRVARTFVWVADEHADLVVGYYSLTGHRLVRDGLPTSMGRGSPTEILAVLLARLAFDRGQQGTGAGGALLADAPVRSAKRRPPTSGRGPSTWEWL